MRKRNRLQLDELQEEPWDIYFYKLLALRDFPTSEQNSFAKTYYEKWKKFAERHRNSRRRVWKIVAVSPVAYIHLHDGLCVFA